MSANCEAKNLIGPNLSKNINKFVIKVTCKENFGFRKMLVHKMFHHIVQHKRNWTESINDYIPKA